MDGKKLFRNVVMVGCLFMDIGTTNAYLVFPAEAWDTYCRELDVNGLKKYLNKGGDFNARVFNGTLLSHASSEGRLDLVRLLLKRGADPDLNYGGDTPLGAAIMRGHSDIVEALVDNGADLDKISGLNTPVSVAVKFCCWKDQKVGCEILSLLLDRGADPNPYFDPPLHAAACHGASSEVIDILMMGGADIKGKDDSGDMPLHVAAKNGNYSQVKILLDWKAPVNALNDNKQTPLDCAISGRNQMRLAMNRECDPSPLVKFQIDRKYKKTIKLLRERGAKIGENIDPESNGEADES
jgi:ankyrin repeat protein